MPLDIIFAGNPRTGKSTLCHTLSGFPFKSGLGFGSGLTTELQFQPEDITASIRYADTPGLDDAKLKEAAADAIHKALDQATKTDRDLKLIFVCTMESGLVYQSHVQTVHFIMDSITKSDGTKLGPDSYAVIINKVSKGVMKELDDNSRNFEKVTNRQLLYATFSEESSNLKFTTGKILLLQREEDLEDRSNKPFTSQAEMIKQFVYNAPRINIKDGSAERINTETLREERKRMEDEFNRMKQDWYDKVAEAEKRRLSEDNKILDQLINKMHRCKIEMCAAYDANPTDDYRWGREAACNNYDDAMRIKHFDTSAEKKAELKKKYEHTLEIYQKDRLKAEEWFSNSAQARNCHERAKKYYDVAIVEFQNLSMLVDDEN